jgi:hypothetical protein
MTAVATRDAVQGASLLGAGLDAERDDLVLRTVGGYVTLTDAATFFGINYWRLRKAVTRGELPARKAGTGQTSPYFVRVPDVTRYLADGFRRRGRRPRPRPPAPADG